jgi:flagellar protein FlbD
LRDCVASLSPNLTKHAPVLKRRRFRSNHGLVMIHLTRLNRAPLVVNADLIAFVEASPDTLLTLINGEKVAVLESVDDVIQASVAFQRRVHTHTRVV